MAATSLTEQLKKLSVPQSAIYKDDGKRPSLLFNPKEAALKDRETFYEIGISGLHELTALYEGFRFYEDSLFSTTSKDFERAVQSKEVNKNLDKNIEKFLIQLSPYLLLESAHKALEWLVNRYSIHQYNQDAVMALILPYHETKIFVRFIQLLDLKSVNNRWNWLAPLQKPGVTLAKQVLHNQCASNTGTLQFIAKTTSKYVKEYGDRATQLNTVYAFFCSTAIGTINTSKKVTESIMNALLPTVIKAIESPIIDFRSSAYVVLGYLSTKATIRKDTFNEIIDKLFTTEFELTYDVVLLINLMYTNQKHIRTMSDAILNDISVDAMNTLCVYFKKLVESKINVVPFILAYLSSILPLIQSGIEEFRSYCELPQILMDEVDLRDQTPEKIIKCILYKYKPKETPAESNDDESDIEIIDEDELPEILLTWYSSFLKSVETKYPDAFDLVVKKEMSTDNKGPTLRHAQLSKVLGFIPSVAHKIGDAYLFENLNNVSSEMRAEAVKYIAKEFEKLKVDVEFVKDSIVSRLNDDHPKVVAAALAIPNEYLEEVLKEDDLAHSFLNIVSKREKKWRSIITAAVLKFCSLNKLPVNQETVLAFVPYLFPFDRTSAELAWHIITSPWGKKLDLLKKLKGLTESQKDNHQVINQVMFNALFNQRLINFDDILEIYKLDKTRTQDVCIYLLLKSCSFKNSPIENINDVLNLLLESVEHEKRTIVSSSTSQPFSSESIIEFILCSKEDKILFEVMEYMFSRIVEDMNVQKIPKPWCDVCSEPETVLIRRLFEIFLTGCTIPTYGENYATLFRKLLDKFFDSRREKFEFIANVACGHILYANDPKDVIGPELQLRSLKLLDNLFAVQDDNSWVYDSDVFLLCVLFNLNNHIAVIRQCVIDIVENNLQRDNPNKNLVYAQLLREILTHKNELLMDREQIIQVLNTILTQSTIGSKVFKKNCLARFGKILAGDTPAHIKSAFLKLFSSADNSAIFTQIVQSLQTIEDKLKENQSDKFALNIYESNILKSVFEHITPATIATISDDKVWRSIETGLKEYRECAIQEDQSNTSPSILILNQIDEDVFKKVPNEKVESLVYLITLAGAASNNPIISSAASRVMKKIHLDFADFKPILEEMLAVQDPNENSAKKKKSSVSMLSVQLTETDKWRLGVTLLEYVQSKKKMTVDNSFVAILFQLLNRCLRFEEQSYVEYPKQLILSSLWYYCKKFVDETDADQLKSLKCMFDVELMVLCIRGTQNPQTHHHALMLLSHAAYMLPEQVLHHTMEIFTFMGSSVLRHDDAYSFQIIIKIIETLVPILVKMDKPWKNFTTREREELHKRVVPVLRIFADVVLHVPEHRRLPLYRKLIETLGPHEFLWVFLALLLETHIAHFNEGKKKDNNKSRTLADQESPINRLDFGQSIVLEFSPEVGLHNFVKLINYLKTLPMQKDEDAMDSDVDPSEIFSVNGHTPVQLRHFRYTIITFISNCLASSMFVQHTSQVKNTQSLEGHYKSLIVNTLTFIQSISKVNDEKTAKYWRVVLHHSYDLLDHTNNLLSPPMFVSVIRGLLGHNLQTVRRKSMELLNSKIQFSPEMFDKVEKDRVFTLLQALLEIIKTAEEKDESLSEFVAQELELNQQTALLSLKLLTRKMAADNPDPFKPVLEVVTNYTCNLEISNNVMASIVLCLAELCSSLKAHALSSLWKFMPALIKVLKKQRKAETPELVLLSTVTAIAKIVESLPLFLSPYLQKILYEYSILLAKWQTFDQECSKVSAIVAKLSNIKKKIAMSIPPRVLIPVANATYHLLLEKENFDAIGPVMSVLADSFANITTADFTALQQDLTTFFLSALQLRSNASEKGIDAVVIDRAEDEVVNALVSLVLKLSETSFRPFYFKIYDWAIRTNVEKQKDRAITFYRLSSAIADKLKGLFVLFAGHFIKNAADLLDACNVSKTEALYFEEDEKNIDLINYILKTLHIVFLYDSQNFLDKNRFETLMQPIVDQLENTVGGIPGLKTRAAESIIPCVAQFAVTTADDSLWKLLNYQILLKTRHNDAEIRLTALDCLVAMASQLGSSWLPLLAESVQFLAELLEDGDSRIETATKEAIRKLEQILGEPLEKYF